MANACNAQHRDKGQTATSDVAGVHTVLMGRHKLNLHTNDTMHNVEIVCLCDHSGKEYNITYYLFWPLATIKVKDLTKLPKKVEYFHSPVIICFIVS